MSKIAKKAVNALMDIYRRGATETILALTDPDNKDNVVMEIKVKSYLTIDEQGVFVNRVINSCFDMDGEYQPQYFDAVFMITLLQMTTNVPVFEKNVAVLNADGTESEETINVVDIEKTYELCKAIDLVGKIKDDSYQKLVSNLKAMANKKLDFVKELRYSQERQMLSKAREELETGVAMVSSIGKQLTTTLEKAGTANNLTDAMKNMNYTEMVSAVMSAT